MRKTFSASLQTLYEMLTFIKSRAEELHFNPSTISQIELASEEAIVNIISYGYPHSEGVIEIECEEFSNDFQGIRIIIIDNGIPYDPLSATEKEKPLIPEKQHRNGGFGIFFMLKIMDKVDYKRVENRNVLTLIRYR